MEPRVEADSLACLTLEVGTASVRPDWLNMRRLAMQPPPQIPGLRARFWRAARGAVIGRYLFDGRIARVDTRPALREFEQAARALRSRGPVAERFDRLPDASTLFDRPVFILSAPRAGSTLLYELLAQCDALWSLDDEMQRLIDGLPALHLANRGYHSQVLNETDADPQTTALLQSCLATEIQSSAGTSLLQQAPGQRPARIRLLEKTPENALRVPFLKRIFPDARFIYLHRDLRQNVSSLIEAWKHPGFVSIPKLPGWPREHWCFLLPERWRELAEGSLCQIAAFQWGAANRAIIEGLEAIPREQWTMVSYAQLLADPAGEITRLCRFMDVEPGARLTAAAARSLPLSATTLSPPSPIKWKTNRDFDPAVVKPLQPLAGRIRALGAHSAPPVNRALHHTTTRFACFVDELTPRASSETGDADIIAPSLLSQPGSGIPLPLVRKVRHHERFLADYPLLWVEDPATQVWTPLWLRYRQAWLCSWLRPGGAPPVGLTGVLREQLQAAGVVTTDQALADRRRHGESLVEHGRAALERLRYCPLPQLLDPVLRGALANYYRQLIAAGDWPLGDAQVEQRHGWHNERIAQFLHNQLTDMVSSISGRPLKPTYCFASAYRGGAVLEAHLDREQCDYTLSLIVDEQAPAGEASWPLWFQTSEGQHQVRLHPGDAVLFRGCELPHWRGSASPDHEQINLLFHFVPAEWAGVMD